MPRAFCAECEAEVPVGDDGRCFLGHDVFAGQRPGDEPEGGETSDDEDAEPEHNRAAGAEHALAASDVAGDFDLVDLEAAVAELGVRMEEPATDEPARPGAEGVATEAAAESPAASEGLAESPAATGDLAAAAAAAAEVFGIPEPAEASESGEPEPEGPADLAGFEPPIPEIEAPADLADLESPAAEAKRPPATADATGGDGGAQPPAEAQGEAVVAQPSAAAAARFYPLDLSRFTARPPKRRLLRR